MAFAAKVYVVPLTELLQVVHVSLEWDLLQINCRLQPWDLLGADGVGTPESQQLLCFGCQPLNEDPPNSSLPWWKGSLVVSLLL